MIANMIENGTLRHLEIIDTIEKLPKENNKLIAKVSTGRSIWNALVETKFPAVSDDEHLKAFSFAHALLTEVVERSQNEPAPEHNLVADRALYPLAMMKLAAGNISSDKRGCEEAKTLIEILINKGRKFIIYNDHKIMLEYPLEFIKDEYKDLTGEDIIPDRDLYDRLTPSSTAVFRTS